MNEQPTPIFFFRAYISAARRLSPSIPKELEEYIAGAYSSIRQEEAKSNTPHSYTTVRTLLSILRISAVSFCVNLRVKLKKTLLHSKNWDYFYLSTLIGGGELVLNQV